MSISHRSSSASATCHLEWRPSRLIAGWLLVLVVLAPLSLIASALPPALAWLAAVLASLIALHSWRNWRRQPPRRLLVRAQGSLTVDGVAHSHWRLIWRGPLAFIEWRDDAGARHALSFWPDTLPAPCRRELRLASPQPVAVSPSVGMAT